MCYCAALPTLETRSRVVILQHPRERTTAIGTARMASLCLPQARLHVGVDWSHHGPLAEALASTSHPPILLYPGPDAKDILAEPPPGPVTLVVVDGTWSQAKVVVRDNPVLAALPRYAFRAPEPSEYRIRREPSDEYVSTIEALMHVLGALEGDAAKFRALLTPFRAMVDNQLASQARSPRGRVRHPRPPRPIRERLPAELFERPEDLVCVVGEANAWPYREALGRPDELVHWVALRPATGEVFEAIAAPTGPLSPTTPFHIGLEEATLHAAPARAALIARFAHFVRDSDVIVSWGRYAPDLFRDAGGALPAARLDLRAAAQRLTQARIGTLDEYVASLGEPLPPVAAGRAGRRVASLARILAAWRALPERDAEADPDATDLANADAPDAAAR
ncbi:MAG: DTW domain-containing protein [Deltaproteobacteria bacterium]|nr:DTW domain-containing protein [Deltaproteobacteria bacterium]